MALSLTQPPGVRSRRGQDAHRLLDVQHWLRHYFSLLGGEQVIPSTLVSYRAGSDWLEAGEDRRIRLIDRNTGDVISLRADLTTQLVHMSTGVQAETLFALAPVFREHPGETDKPREVWQGTMEFLHCQHWSTAESGMAPLPYAFLAALYLAQRWFGIDWTLILGSVNIHQENSTPLQGSYRLSDTASPGWYHSLGTTLSSSALDYVRQADLIPAHIYSDTVLPVARSYYNGWYFRVFAKGFVEPVLFGGEYRDPMRRGDHIGFGVDLEQLASLETAPGSVPGVVPSVAAVRVTGDAIGSALKNCWDEGIKTRSDAKLILATSSEGWYLGRQSGQSEAVFGTSDSERAANLKQMLVELSSEA